MPLTLQELIERLRREDEVSLLEMLDISSEELVQKFEELIEERYEELSEEYEDEVFGEEDGREDWS